MRQNAQKQRKTAHFAQIRKEMHIPGMSIFFSRILFVDFILEINFNNNIDSIASIIILRRKSIIVEKCNVFSPVLTVLRRLAATRWLLN